ncbi:hypothetical protein SORBI_3002G178400 [Sorghum bicolor]|uniref:Uncharacterized protein n=1 Tax=Sorghum bicolor TaxID=4558 RepID=A0A1B6QC22_SORBI|nr:hypothetical protein SORBI_3002G178400 [Sorghum bicolor]
MKLVEHGLFLPRFMRLYIASHIEYLLPAISFFITCTLCYGFGNFLPVSAPTLLLSNLTERFFGFNLVAIKY